MAQGVGILNTLKGRMQWHQARQKVLAENVANSDTPKFQPKDLVPYAQTLGGGGPATLLRTQPMHMAASMTVRARRLASVPRNSRPRRAATRSISRTRC